MPLKKSQLVCPNPLFLIWLEEWRKEAEERDLNSRFTYGKAISSLKKYPLPLRSGKEAKILENVGDGIAKRLDERLKQYLDDGGDPEYLHKINPELEAKNNVKENTREYVCKYRSGPYALILTLYQESEDPLYKGYMLKNELQTKAQPLCDKSLTIPDPGSHYTAWSSMGTLTKKGYIKKQSSPAQYFITDSGIALALRLLQGTHDLSDNTMKYLRKSNSPSKSKTTNRSKDINTKHSENDSLGTSNLLAEIRNNGYMVNKSLNSFKTSSSTITKNISNNKEPPLPHIPGLQNSILIDDDEREKKHKPPKNAKPPSPKRKSSQISINISESNDQLFSLSKKPSLALSPSANNPPKILSFWYVTDSGNVTVLKSKAMVTIDDDLGLGFLIKTKKCELIKSNQKYKLDETKKEIGGFVFAFITDAESTEIASPPDFDTPSKTYLSSLPSSTSSIPIGNSGKESELDEDDSLLLPDLNNILNKDTSQKKSKSKNRTLGTNSVTLSKNLTHSNKDRIDLSNNYVQTKETIRKDLSRNSGVNKHGAENTKYKLDGGKATQAFTKKWNNVIDIDKLDSHEKVEIDKPITYTELLDLETNDMEDMEPLFVLNPGSFDILLCVDVIETSGAGKRKKELADKLISSKVNMNIRKLQLGDFLWVAKEKGGSQRELVLDFIVERKRMDDLASSIVDGRFREQKFRLKSSGLLKLIYLVEKYGSVDHYPVPVTTLQQAMTNTQLIDGLFVKETMDIYDSINYLSLVTAQISSLYSKKTLYALNMEKVRTLKMNKDHEDLLDQNIQYFSTFEEFSLETNKNKMLTVSELFAKQLMMIKGISMERALTIIERYPTPCSLVNAFNSLHTQNKKEKLLSEITFGKNKRKLGDPLSIQVYLMYSKLNTI